ncbi:hypothetical protein WH52_09045 [Tenacibaculum holothuriorum]|uniref:Polysaccharide pyruvyl transferase domain-containing protein n=1 Tax=Tenacibaculum holothuriorum TaxID=1635173 RepID=A0A1Y2PCG6_9FLAO|nr:hypothetical protein WH52_09045 [Tenacibaculum holothuriorum]
MLLFLKAFKKEISFSFLEQNTNKKVFVFLAADYGNLGDVAITYAQTRFLKEVLNEYEVVDVPISKTLDGIYQIKKYISKDDIVTTVGGGNFGDLYEQIEFYRQLIVESFPNNKIISFPQTIDFSESKKGQKALRKAIKRYGKHKDLTFVAREKVSYALMKKLLKNNVILTPDIVMSLDKILPKEERNGVVLCLRKDNEKLLKENEQNKLLEIVKNNFEVSKEYDTHIGRNNLTLEERNEELNKIWRNFKEAELVITDRLHGMIFCYITNTPCLVFPNNNHKVKGSLEWIKDRSNIKLVEKFLEDEIENFISEKKFVLNNHKPVYESFEGLIKLLKS